MEDTYKETMAAIAGHKKVMKAVGVSSNGEDMHLYSFNLPGLETKRYKILHKRCFEKGKLEGYEYIQLDRILDGDAGCRVVCVECGERKDEVRARVLEEERALKLKHRAESYKAWIREQVLLGKL